MTATSEANYEKLPEHLRRGMRGYVEHGQPVGSFLRAVLQDNLMLTVIKADPESLAALKDIMNFVLWEIPSVCHGSEKKCTEWIEAGGYEGRFGKAS